MQHSHKKKMHHAIISCYIRVGDLGTRLMFKFRSDTNGLNEELGKHRGKNGDRRCKFCEDEYKSGTCAVEVSCIRNIFMGKLDKLLGGGRFEELSTLDNFNRTWVRGQWCKRYGNNMSIIIIQYQQGHY